VVGAIIGDANPYTAALCELTNGQPGAVCESVAAAGK
jgi:hypothetical protein